MKRALTVFVLGTLMLFGNGGVDYAWDSKKGLEALDLR